MRTTLGWASTRQALTLPSSWPDNTTQSTSLKLGVSAFAQSQSSVSKAASGATGALNAEMAPPNATCACRSFTGSPGRSANEPESSSGGNGGGGVRPKLSVNVVAPSPNFPAKKFKLAS
eukprot:scaffold6226_cov228-Pinguiococcus_pyrenoidosus.AAC.2